MCHVTRQQYCVVTYIALAVNLSVVTYIFWQQLRVRRLVAVRRCHLHILAAVRRCHVHNMAAEL